jgi:hypothetical protein
VSDDLSCRVVDTRSFVVSMVTAQCLELVTSAYSQDPDALELLTKLSVAGKSIRKSIPNFTLVNGLLRYTDKVWLGSTKPIQ